MLSHRARQLTLSLLLRPATAWTACASPGLVSEAAVGWQPAPAAGTSIPLVTTGDLRILPWSFTQQFHGTGPHAVHEARKQTATAGFCLHKAQLSTWLSTGLVAPLAGAGLSADKAERRGFSSDKISELEAGAPSEGAQPQQNSTKPSVEELNPAQLLKRMSIMRFREHLANLAETTPSISYQELLQQCQESGAASSPAEAQHTCSVLADAGVVLRFADLVYLRPMEIAEYVVQALPGSETQVQQRVDALKAELAPLEARKAVIDARASRWVRGILWFGLAAFMFQWLLFFRLTFWELSWDVMEPTCYFVSSAGGIAAYCYFLATHEDFSYAPWRDRVAANLQVGGYARQGLDLRRLQMLQRDVHRLERFLKR